MNIYFKADISNNIHKGTIPGDPEKPAVTNGLGEAEMKQIAHCIGMPARDFEETQAEVQATVAAICEKFPLYK